MYRRFHIERLKFARRLGRRGMLLLLFGIVWAMVGITNILIPQDRFSSPGIGPDRFLQILDGPELSLAWVIAGGIAATVGFFHDRRVFNKHEAYGWNAILTMPLVWVMCLVWSFATWIVTDGEGGRANGLYGALVWTVVSLVIMVVAGWPEEKFETSINPVPGSVHSADDPEVYEDEEK